MRSEVTGDPPAGNQPAGKAGHDSVPAPTDAVGRHQRPAPPPDRPPLPMGVRPNVPQGRPPVPGAHHTQASDQVAPQPVPRSPAINPAGWGPPPSATGTTSIPRAPQPRMPAPQSRPTPPVGASRDAEAAQRRGDRPAAPSPAAWPSQSSAAPKPHRRRADPAVIGAAIVMVLLAVGVLVGILTL